MPFALPLWLALLAQNPPDNVRPIIEQQIKAIDQALGASAPVAVPAGGTSARVRIHVTVAPTLKSDQKGDVPLFIFVRDPQAGGPPLAVKRLAAHFPQTVELSSADAMLAGHGMQVGQDVEIVARISGSGGPLARSGDPFGSVAYHVAAAGTVNVVIDRLTP